MNNKELNFTDLTRLLLRKKWVFIIILIIVFVASFAYFYMQPEEYTYESRLKVAEDYINSNNELYNYYPEDMEKLWLFPTHRRNNLEDVAMDMIISELYSDEIINDLKNKLGQDINTENIRSYINIIRDNQNNNIFISTTHNTSEIAENINRSLIDTCIEKKQLEFEKTYETLLAKITEDVESLNNELEDLNYKKNTSEAEYYLENSKPVSERDVGYIAEKLANVESFDRRINNLNKKYNLLSTTKNNLLNNKDFFINRITVIQEPQFSGSKEFNLKNSIIYSILVGLIIAFIITFIVAIASYARHNRKY